MAKLYVVATPIGNLEDVTLRALRILRSVDLIACEDTRTTMKLLSRYEIKTKLVSYFQHSRPSKARFIVEQIKNGKDVALVSEAGTPSISDPGTVLVAEAVKSGIDVVPIPGASAVTAAASVSGLPVDKFAFYGFLPVKKGRVKIIEKMLSEDKTVLFYESPHRILRTLGDLRENMKANFDIIVFRELTKKFEEITRGNIDGIFNFFKNLKKIKGEIVVIFYKNAK